MAAKPAPGAAYFTEPRHPNQRRYEALRAYFTEGLAVAEAGARAGYTRSSMASLLRDFRAGRLELFAPPGRPGPRTAPAKDRARARVLELRREGLSVYEISARLRAEGTPLNRTGVGQVLAEEGFGRLPRGPAPASISPATPGRDTQLPAPRSSTSPRSPPAPIPGSPGCCWPSPTWYPSACPPRSARPATPAPPSSPPCPGCCPCSPSSSPAPGGSPTSMTC